MKKIYYPLFAISCFIASGMKAEAQTFIPKVPNTKSSVTITPHRNPELPQYSTGLIISTSPPTSLSKSPAPNPSGRDNNFSGTYITREIDHLYHSPGHDKTVAPRVDTVQQLSDQNDSLIKMIAQLQDSLHSLIALKREQSNNNNTDQLEPNISASKGNTIKVFENIPIASASSAGIKKVRLNDISMPVLRDFMNNYKEAKNETWYSIDKGFVAIFSSGEMKTSVTYKRNGEWLYSIKKYDEKDMPTDVRALVKSTYYDYKIAGIEEIQVPRKEKKIFLVYVEDANSIKVLRVYDGDMEIIHDYIRS